MEQTSAERRLVQACKRGDRKAQSALYHRYACAMYNVALRMMNDSAEAEDMLQDAFVTVFQKLEGYRFEAPLGAWIKKIVVNKCINTLRANKNKLTLELEDTMIPLEQNLLVEPAYTVQNIKFAIASLSPGYRTITNLYLFEGYDHSEIAQILKISESTSKSQYHRAKKKIIDIIHKLK